MKVERIFNEDSNLNLNIIFESIILEQLDTYVNNKYYPIKINNATSSNLSKGDVI